MVVVEQVMTPSLKEVLSIITINTIKAINCEIFKSNLRGIKNDEVGTNP